MLWQTNGDNGRVLREPTSSFLSFRHRVHIWEGLKNGDCPKSFSLKKNVKEPI